MTINSKPTQLRTLCRRPRFMSSPISRDVCTSKLNRIPALLAIFGYRTVPSFSKVCALPSFTFFASHVFSDVCGKLEGDSIVGASIEGTPNTWYREVLPPSPTSPSGVRPATVPSPPPIITESRINSLAGDWRELVLQAVGCENTNIRISTKAPELLEGRVRRR